MSETNNKYFTGVGSRSTPEKIINLMFFISGLLSKKGYILRSGGADGADLACEKGIDFVNGLKDIYIPWQNFNNSNSDLYDVSNKALELAKEIHPNWSALSQGGQKLHARNCYQVLGKNLDNPSELMICWTENGEDKGGTRTAIMLARKYNVPIYNLFSKKDVIKLFEFLAK